MTHSHDFALDVTAIATHFALTEATVRSYLRAGRLPGVRLKGEWKTSWDHVWGVERGPTPRSANRQAYQLPLLSKSDLACRLATSVRTIEGWLASGMPTRNVFSNVRIAPVDAETWLIHTLGLPETSAAVLKGLLRE
ncbi:DNA-binding protein [Phaeobacter sp. 22II1-1F12B]|uniref:DNA-binding protein n=1 Tax=Phaeobacter sp. 22II1-1F12B TaxID=1317111 RepID=UPI000B522B3C|nr:DNA-binding protein [Phaeobacter sp. 22II1-1F12B]